MNSSREKEKRNYQCFLKRKNSKFKLANLTFNFNYKTETLNWLFQLINLIKSKINFNNGVNILETNNNQTK